MAAADVIVLSSPPRMGFGYGAGNAAFSSSPGFPSPSALLRKQPELLERNRTAPVPMNAACTLKTTSSPLTQHGIEDGFQVSTIITSTALHSTPEIDAGAQPSVKIIKSKATKKPRTSREVSDTDNPSIKKTRKPRARKAEAEIGESAPKVKAARKPRVKKDASGSQTKLPKGRVTKASSIAQAEKSNKKRKSDEVNSHFATDAEGLADSFDSHTDSGNGLLLQEAVRRRTHWTPPQEDTNSSNFSIDPTLNPEPSSTESIAASDGQKSISELFGKYGFNKELHKDRPSRVVDPAGSRKRRLIGLVKTNASAPLTPTTKVPATKKKPRTITEQATSAYVISNDENVDPVPAPLLQYFSHQNSASNGNVLGPVDDFKVPAKPRSRNPTKTLAKASKATKAKKGTAEAPILLSPQSALKRVESQEFIFGTSSQLAREESPTLLRDLHQAMRESNLAEGDPFADALENLVSPKSPSISEKGTESFVAKRNLWGAASNGVNGESGDIQMVDLSTSPGISKTESQRLDNTRLPNDVVGNVLGRNDDVWHELEDHDPATGRTTKGSKKSLKSNNPEVHIQQDIPSSARSLANSGNQSSSQPRKSTSKPSTDASKSLKDKAIQQKPDYGSYATTQLAKEIASYHFKPVKGRDQMIALLEKCWEGKQKVSSGLLGATEIPTSIPVQPSKNQNKSTRSDVIEPPMIVPETLREDAVPAGSPRRPRAQAKPTEPVTLNTSNPLVLRQTPKKKVKQFMPTPEEIYDSESETTPPPPRRRQLQVLSPPPSLTLSTASTDPAHVSTTQQNHLHKYISLAITSAPRSADSKNPSWHEKILLYDPIVLENLAEWLNSGHLKRVGWSGETAAAFGDDTGKGKGKERDNEDGSGFVSAKEVKAWCWERGICCLWRENLRGATRTRF